jgi:hypothetical protein
MKAFILTRRKLDAATVFYRDSLTRSLLLGLTLTQWRRNTLHIRSVRAYILEQEANRQFMLLSLVFRALQNNTYRCLQQKNAVKYLHDKNVRKYIDAWVSVRIKYLRLNEFENERKSIKQRSCIRTLKTAAKASRKSRRKEEKNSTLVTCFFVLRVFLAWKRSYISTRLSLTWLPDVATLYKADLFFVRRMFNAWRDLKRLRRSNLSAVLANMNRLRTNATIRRVLWDWHCNYLSNRFCRIRCQCRFLDSLIYRVRLSSRISMEEASRHYSHTSVTRTLHMFYFTALKSSRLRRAYTSLSSRVSTSLVRQSLLQWRQCMRTRITYLEMHSTAIAHNMRYITTVFFRAWVQATRGQDVRLFLDLSHDRSIIVPASIQYDIPGAVEASSTPDQVITQNYLDSSSDMLSEDGNISDDHSSVGLQTFFVRTCFFR